MEENLEMEKNLARILFKLVFLNVSKEKILDSAETLFLFYRIETQQEKPGIICKTISEIKKIQLQEEIIVEIEGTEGRGKLIDFRIAIEKPSETVFSDIPIRKGVMDDGTILKTNIKLTSDVQNTIFVRFDEQNKILSFSSSKKFEDSEEGSSSYLQFDKNKWVWVILFVILCGLIILIVFERNYWRKYKKEKKCIKIGEKEILCF